MPSALPAALCAALLGLTPAGPAAADAVLGLWRTEPDGKGQTGDVRFRACGGAFCGRIVAAHDPEGREIVTPNVGREIVSGLAPRGGGVYEGSIFVPLLGASFPATFSIEGGAMTLKACNALGICRTQRWSRLE